MRPPHFPILPPWRGLPLIVLCACYLLVGLIGHDPWKNDDAMHFGLAWDVLRNQHWLVPQLQGQAWLATPPLYYWIAAACGWLFGPILPLHDAIRLASALCGALFLVLIGLAARLLYKTTPKQKPSELENQTRRLTGNAAPLIAIGCLGLLLPIHDTQPLTAVLAASAAAYGGLILLPLRPYAGGLLAGLGIALGFLSGGFMVLAQLLPLLLLLPGNAHWRTSTAIKGLLCAAAIALPLGLSWPLWLAQQQPATYALWLNQVIHGLNGHGEGWKNLPDLAYLLAWFAWPAWPLAGWAVWLNRSRLNLPALALPLIGTATSFGIILLFGEPQPLAALPLLPPLILLAASSAHLLRRGAANAFDWFAMITFSGLAALVWLGASALYFGVPGKIAHNAARLTDHFSIAPNFMLLTTAGAFSLAWLWLIFASPRSAWRGLSHWAGGLTLCWILLISLWLPWIDHAKSYRAVAQKIATVIAEQPEELRTSCIAARQLGAAQTISLDYFAALQTRPTHGQVAENCALLLQQAQTGSPSAQPDWELIWQGQRPADRREQLRLYRRTTALVKPVQDATSAHPPE